MRNNFKRFLGVAFVLIMALSVMTVGAFAAEETVSKIGDAEYKTLAAAMTEAVAGDKITLTADVTEDVTINKAITFDGAEYTYTGKMTIKADTTIKNVNFDGKGYNGYAVETRGADYLTIEDCTAKNYGWGFVQLASGTALTTVKNVTVSNMNYGVKSDYSNAVVIENADIAASVAGILNSNYGEKTITVKDSKISIIGTWTRNNTINSTFLFKGANTVDKFVIDANIDTFKLAEGATLTAPAVIDVTTDVADSYVAYKNGVYSVESNTKVAAIGENQYKTLADAVAAAAVKGDTITLLSDVNENVTISKNLTIDGNGNQYTGNILTTDKNANYVIKNVNFVDCDVYAIKSNGAKSLTIENCTATNCGYGLLYANKTTSAIAVKNVEIDGASYGLRITSNNKTTLENVTMKNVNYGIEAQTTGKREFNFINCTIDAVKTPFNAADKGAGVQTLNFKSVNDFGIDVTTLESNLVKVNAAAQIGTKIYGDLKTAVADAKDGDVITIIADQTLDNKAMGVESGMYSLILVSDKAVTIDLNGKKITANVSLDKKMLAVFGANNTGSLTLKDSSEAQTGAVDVTMADGTQAYSMFTTLGSSKMYIEGGNYSIDKIEYGQSMMYAGQNEQMFVSGGNFYLGNAKTRDPGNGEMQPWFYNAHGDGIKFIAVSGGTYNVDPTHYHGETKYPYCYDAVENEDGTWTVKYSPAVEIGETGYESLKEAVAAAKDGDVITVCKDQTLNNKTAEIADYKMYSYITVSDKKITIDLNGKTITANPKFDKAFYGVLVVNGTGDVTLTDNSTDKTGAINVTVAEGTESYSMLSTDGATSKLTIESGNYYIDRVDKGYSMIYIAQTGTGYVNGGNFVLGNAKTMIRNGVAAPWIFNTVGNAKNVVYVNGGRYNTDPDHHWGEAKFKKGYVTVQAEDGMWDIVRGPVIVEQPTDITIGYNKMAKFAPVIKGEGLTYTWYYKDANATKFSTSTIKTATYDIQGTVARNGREIYCVAKDVTGKKVTTATVKLTVVPNEELEIVSQPTEVYGALDTTVSVKMDVKGDGLTYKWEFRNKGASTFQKSTIKTATYDLLLSKDRMDREVRCTITDAFGKQVVSDIITLKATCTTPLEIIEQPTYEAVAVGETVKIKMNVQGEYLTYKWYFRNAGSTKWTVSSIKDSEYDLVLSKDRIGRQVYCVITDAFGNPITTEAVTLYAAE